MSEEKKAFGCGAKSNPESTKQEVEVKEKKENIKKDGVVNMVKLGKLAPDFEVPAYHNGEFTTAKLSDYRGKWVLLCFYPGDFTFV